MSSVASYESLVHAVSGAVVSERAGAARGARGAAGGAAVVAWRGARAAGSLCSAGAGRGPGAGLGEAGGRRRA